MISNLPGIAATIGDVKAGSWFYFKGYRSILLGYKFLDDKNNQYILEIDRIKQDNTSSPHVIPVHGNSSSLAYEIKNAIVVPNINRKYLGSGIYNNGLTSKILRMAGDTLIVQAERDCEPWDIDISSGKISTKDNYSSFYTKNWSVFYNSIGDKMEEIACFEEKDNP